ncbi:hypothetical protein P7K49_023034 [Saguinus oedipus]|uniref:Uncharacterized protein n=1 Tax=Saguinus oedipus TaxID=9490 RepID=A0ABQ9UM13_SAGOE|nr:hypothetical protein P7K49_023034 [Saguinus oedipus]
MEAALGADGLCTGTGTPCWSVLGKWDDNQLPENEGTEGSKGMKRGYEKVKIPVYPGVLPIMARPRDLIRDMGKKNKEEAMRLYTQKYQTTKPPFLLVTQDMERSFSKGSVGT